MNRFLKKIDPASRKILYTCFFAFFFSGLFSLMMGSLMPDMRAQYGFSATQSGLMLSGHSMGNLISGFLSGFAPLFLGRRKSIMYLSALSVVGFAMMLLFGNPIWLIVAFVLTGIGRGSVSNFNNGTVSRISNGSPAASNLLHCFFAVGALSAPMVFLLTSRIGGWKLAVGVIVLIGIGVFFRFSQTRFEDDHVDRKDKKQSSMVFLKNPSFLIFAAMMFFYLCAEYSINGWLVTYLQNKPEMLQAFATAADPQAVLKSYSQSMATLLWVIILVGRLTCAALSNRIPQKKLMVITSFGAVLFFSLLLFGGSPTLVSVAVAGLGFSLAGICPMIYSDASYITNIYPMGTSTLLALGVSGAILMPSLVGVMTDAFDFNGGMSCILASVVLLLVFAVLNAVLKPRPVQDDDR